MRISDWSSDVCSSDLGSSLRMNAAHEIDEPLDRLPLRLLCQPEALQRLAIGAIGIGKFDDLRCPHRPNNQCIRRIDGAEALPCTRILGKGRQIDAILVVDRGEQKMLAFGREIDDSSPRTGLIYSPSDWRRTNDLKRRIGEGLAQLTLRHPRRPEKRRV